MLIPTLALQVKQTFYTCRERATRVTEKTRTSGHDQWWIIGSRLLNAPRYGYYTCTNATAKSINDDSPCSGGIADCPIAEVFHHEYSQQPMQPDVHRCHRVSTALRAPLLVEPATIQELLIIQYSTPNIRIFMHF